ncbi:UNKNOWN [Stylonychia lemnae]|uniref:Uncharacterized protein n=1 Tax=Stylonychia lemnae TaxID=5949 RepID=A0A077ZPC8_STYLE|nr:UNKNOWN [Stylonychia lemnae]|eukprot:CDW71250.1 UNKNOWN [Stylonychia lemnae]
MERLNNYGDNNATAGGYKMPFRQNNIAFMRADEKPYQKDLSQYVRTDRDDEMLRSAQSQKSKNFYANNSVVDQIINSKISEKDLMRNAGGMYNGMTSNQYRLSQSQFEDRIRANSRSNTLQMEQKLQDHERMIGSRGSQRLPPLRQDSSRQSLNQNQYGGDEYGGFGYKSEQNSGPRQMNDPQFGANKPIFQSQLGKIATTVNQKVNVYGEGMDEIKYRTVNKILDDYDDQDKIKRLEDNLENMKEEIELTKYKYEQKQLNDLEMKEREMLNKADELERAAQEDHEWRNMIRDRMIQMKLKNQEIEKREKQYEEYIHRMERETEVEKLVRKKLEIEKMKQQQDMMDELLRKKEQEIKGIGTQLEKKDIDSSNMLKKAIQRADILQKQLDSGVIDTKTQSLLVDTILDKNPENEQIRKQIMEEVKAKMSRDKDDQQYKNEELLQQLNIQRMKFLEAEKIINEKKQVNQEIMRRGLDFLAEIELGNAPPLEYVVKNIYQNRQDKGVPQQQPGGPVPAKQVVQYIQDNLRGEEQKLQDLQDDYSKTLGVLQQSTQLNLVNPDRYRVFIPEYKRNLVAPIVNDILENVFYTIQQNEINSQDVKKNINRLKQQKQAREARIDQLAGTISIKELSQQILEGVIESMAKQIAQESTRLNDLAMMKSFDVIVKALKTQRGYKNGEPDMKKILMGQQAEIKVQVEQVQEKKKDKNAKDEDYIDENADVIDPNESLAYITNDFVKDIEKDYFTQNVNIEKLQIFGGTLGNKSGGVTAFAVSNNKSLVVEAINNGQILVYSVSKNYALVRKIITKNTQVYTQVEFSRDNISQILAVSFPGSIVKSFAMKDRNELPPLDPNLGQPIVKQLELRTIVDDQPQDLVPNYEVNYEAFLTPDLKKDKTNQKEYAIMVSQLHSQMTSNGCQDQIIISSKNGAIIRFNANPPQSQQQSQGGENKEAKDMFKTANSNVDFILGHKVPVIFLQSVENPTNPLQSPQLIISIDVAGHIFVWKKPQDKDKFPSKPAAKFRIGMQYNKFVRANEVRQFPPGKEKEIEAAKSINAKIMQTITAYMETGIVYEAIKRKALDILVKANGGVQTFILPPVQPPAQEEELKEFEEYVFNAQNFITRRANVKYKTVEAAAKLGSIKSSKNKRFVCIELLKDHLFSTKDIFTHEFVIFRSEEFRLGKYKASINVEKNAITDFDLSDEVQNQPLKIIDFAPEFAKVSKKKVKFDRITIGNYQEVYLNSASWDATLLIKLENIATPEKHLEYVKNYSKLAECWK